MPAPFHAKAISTDWGCVEWRTIVSAESIRTLDRSKPKLRIALRQGWRVYGDAGGGR